MPEVVINGPEGRLEGRYSHSKQPNPPLALILHPSPEMGGTMNNRICVGLYQTFIKKGFSTLRFNFRGVGKSQGEFDRGEGELSDAAAALDWLNTANPTASVAWIAGFSFGALVGMQLLMRRPEIHRFVSIAPPANTEDFTFLAPCPSSGLILYGDRDDQVTTASVEDLAQRLKAQRGLDIEPRLIPGANHYFAQSLPALIEEIDGYIDASMGGEFAAAI